MEIVGRRQEVADAKKYLSRSRLLTLTGVGGVGKTRLALRTAGEVKRGFPDGAWLVELASVQDRALLARTVTTALSLPDPAVRAPVETLTEFLQDKRLLLVLDNCEHLLDACAELIDGLLASAPGLRILATSRERLGLPEEFVFAVPPLSVPESDDGNVVGALSEYGATALFTKRAELVVPNFTIDATNRSDVARLCQRLDGIPLAIELAAVRLRVLSPGQILDRLDDRFRLLSRPSRSAPPRQQTLQAAVDWSYELCSLEEQTLWARLSVFSGGLDLQAAEQVCDGGPIAREDVFDLVAALIEKSILVRKDDGARARYQLLETLRQYGEERLIESGEQQEFRGRHRDHYRDLAERARQGWFAPGQVEWFTRISRERANFRVALEHCFTMPGEARAALEIAAALYGFWVFYGAFGEARHWLDRILGQEKEPGPERFKALMMNATFTLMQGELDLAWPLMEECREYAEESGDARSQALITFLYGRAALLRGDYKDAVQRLEAALEWNRSNRDAVSRNGDMSEVFLTAFYLAIAASFVGDERSAEYAAQCRRVAKKADALGEISMAVWVTGIERWRAGETRQAIALFQESLGLDHAYGYRYSPAWSIEALGWATATDGQHEHAACLLGAAARLRRLMGLSLPGFRPYADAHERCEARLREVLGTERYTANFQRGTTLGREDAIAMALGQDTEPHRARVEVPEPAVLTPREQQVADLVAEGMSNSDLAARLVIAQRTAECHVEHILVKLGFTSRTQIAAWASARKGDESDTG